MELESALGYVRAFIADGIDLEAAISNPAIPEEFREEIRRRLKEDEVVTFEPPDIVTAQESKSDWLDHLDRSTWTYWPAQRRYLLAKKKWPGPVVESIETSSDHILKQLADPRGGNFRTRGLVIGYVQSGKTANYTAVMAKAADVGYRFFVVLSGIDNALRRQTQIRLKQELVGYPHDSSNSIDFPPRGKVWHEFTTEDLGGDFHAGNASPAALQGSQPVLVVIKKNGQVMKRLLDWLDDAPEDVIRAAQVLVIDDEADQASIDTRGDYLELGQPIPDDYEEPSVINGLIRELLSRFRRCAYVGYTATPYANILIAHDTYDADSREDLYPKDFIVSLPKPIGYSGPEELFGEVGSLAEDKQSGMDVIRVVPDSDIGLLKVDQLPDSLNLAILDFVLAGAERSRRGDGSQPCTMLIHTSRLIDDQNRLAQIVEDRFAELKNRWRYLRSDGIVTDLEDRWNQGFKSSRIVGNTASSTQFETMMEDLNTFFEKVQVLVVNSATGDILDYKNEPGLKAIAIGGNRLSRGLTLEGLICSYFIRESRNYDTLMQMGRWFGFREGYADLTRIYTTRKLKEWLSDLAIVERTIRQDLKVYVDDGLTPLEVGMRIRVHPDMQVTSRTKRRYSKPFIIKQSYDNSVAQTFKFPFSDPDRLVEMCDMNLDLTKEFLGGLGAPKWDKQGPIWTAVRSKSVLDFLEEFKVEEVDNPFSAELIRGYIEKQMDQNELVRWVVAVRGRESLSKMLGSVDWGIPGGTIKQIYRSRVPDINSLGVITNPDDEAAELPEANGNLRGSLAREERDAQEGLLIIYPISKYSGQNLKPGGSRGPIYTDPEDEQARDLIGIALSFPKSENRQPIEVFIEGTARWRVTE